jgi:hypothetical protein
MLKSILASIAIFFSGIFGVHQPPVVSIHQQPSATVLSQPAGATVATVSGDTSTVTPAKVTTPPSSAPTDMSTSTTSPGTVIKQYITNPPIERIIEKQGAVLGESTDATNAQLSDLQNQINALRNSWQPTFVSSFSGPAASTPVSTAVFAQSQRIDHLDGVTITNSTVNGTSDFSGGGGDFLPLTGGTLTGQLVSNSTATSTFANGISLSGGCVTVNGACLGAGGGTPGGLDTQVQFDDGGSFVSGLLSPPFSRAGGRPRM